MKFRLCSLPICLAWITDHTRTYPYICRTTPLLEKSGPLNKRYLMGGYEVIGILHYI
jgi:hypothetical protein